MNREQFEQYITDNYSAMPEHPWARYPGYAVFRHSSNRKWFAVAMTIPKNKLQPDGEGMIDIFNVKCDPIIAGSFRQQNGIYPAYHMSKGSWLSVSLDGSVGDDTIKMLLDISWDLTRGKIKKKTAQR